VSDRSDDWFRDPAPRSSGRGASGYPGASEPAGSVFGGGNQGSVWEPSGQQAGGSGYRSPGAWPEQPPVRGRQGGRAPQYQGGRPAGSGGGYQGRGSAGRSTGGRGRRWLRPRRILAIIALVVVVILVLSGVGYFYLNSKLTRINALVDYANRPAASDGQNWLITGSDSRQGLTRRQERQLATGRGIGGHRSDTVMLLHIPSSGPAVLVSLPRDSYLPIPGFGMNKLNAAYAFGGPKLLAKTVQNATGLRIDHYMGIGFGGLVNVVDAVGGVRMCIPQNLDDPASGLHLKKGCQNLSGAEALGFVRTRHLFATQDLQREQNQRAFIKALLTKMTSVGTLANPFTAFSAANGAASSLTVDKGTQLYQLIQVAFALRHPETTTVPIGPSETLAVGDVLIWNQTQAERMFSAMKNGQPVPKSLITGSKVG
jgi:LCP family protein required for cell wall assembly